MSDHLSTNEWMVICALKQEPHCKLVGEQAALADRMAGKGLLLHRAGDKGEYTVTVRGWNRYYRVVGAGSG